MRFSFVFSLIFKNQNFFSPNTSILHNWGLDVSVEPGPIHLLSKVVEGGAVQQDVDPLAGSGPVWDNQKVETSENVWGEPVTDSLSALSYLRIVLVLVFEDLGDDLTFWVRTRLSFKREFRTPGASMFSTQWGKKGCRRGGSFLLVRVLHLNLDKLSPWPWSPPSGGGRWCAGSSEQSGPRHLVWCGRGRSPS